MLAYLHPVAEAKWTHFDETATRLGLLRLARWSFSTLSVMVAEKR